MSGHEDDRDLHMDPTRPYLPTALDVTPAVERAGQAGPGAHGRAVIDPRVSHVWQYVAVNMLAAALNGPKDQYGVMDDMTIEIHGAICESSPEGCVEWRGACVKAAEAARKALLGAEQ